MDSTKTNSTCNTITDNDPLCLFVCWSSVDGPTARQKIEEKFVLSWRIIMSSLTWLQTLT